MANPSRYHTQYYFIGGQQLQLQKHKTKHYNDGKSFVVRHIFSLAIVAV